MSDFLKDKGQPVVYKVIDPFIRFLVRIGVTPNFVTFVGFFINILVAVVFVWGANFARGDLRVVGWGGALILFAGLFDMMDGRLARESGQTSDFGALYDSVLDRYSELVMFLGVCYYLIAQDYFLSSLFAFIAMIGSIMVSYVRARAEGLGVQCAGGLMQRPERILTIGLSAILCGFLEDWIGLFKYTIPGTSFPIFESITIFTFPLFVMAIMTNATAIRRIRDSKRLLEEKAAKEAEAEKKNKKN